jgi:hypothetical protein
MVKQEQLNLLQRGAVRTAPYFALHLKANALPALSYNDFVRMPVAGRGFSQPAPRFNFPNFDSKAINVIGKQSRTTTDAKLKAEFDSLVKQWQQETSFHSSLGEIFTHEAYQRIMAMGRDALPLILSELRRKPGHWFYALEKIAGDDKAVGAKNFAAARAAWLEWGYKNNYI